MYVAKKSRLQEEGTMAIPEEAKTEDESYGNDVSHDMHDGHAWKSGKHMEMQKKAIVGSVVVDEVHEVDVGGHRQRL